MGKREQIIEFKLRVPTAQASEDCCGGAQRILRENVAAQTGGSIQQETTHCSVFFELIYSRKELLTNIILNFNFESIICINTKSITGLQVHKYHKY